MVLVSSPAMMDWLSFSMGMLFFSQVLFFSMRSKRSLSMFFVMVGLIGLSPFNVARAWSVRETMASPSFPGSVMYLLLKASFTIWCFSFPLMWVSMPSPAASASFRLASCSRMV